MTAAADPPPAAPPLAPPQDLARLDCPGCGQPMRFVARAAYSTDAGRAWRCWRCHAAIGVIVVGADGQTRVRLAAASST